MFARLSCLLAVLTLACLWITPAATAESPKPAQEAQAMELLPAFTAKLAKKEPVTVVCLGDSVTGIYYHTGGLRAYPEMLELALRKIVPETMITVINSGISGQTTADGLKRFQKDVLDHNPDLVTIMFNLNDIVRVSPEDYRSNLERMITLCREHAAEVLLCTPNGVEETPGRELAKLVSYCDILREVGQKTKVPVCDIYGAYVELQQRDPVAWRRLLSDQFHPNMDGHRMNAEVIAATLTGKQVSLDDIDPPQPALRHTLAPRKAGEPIRVMAMAPYDQWIADAFQKADPRLKVEVRSWPTAGQSLEELHAFAKTIRAAAPLDLVIVALPGQLLGTDKNPSEEVLANATWILNFALSFGIQEWDVISIAPSVTKASRTAEEQLQDEFVRALTRAQDLTCVTRPEASEKSAEELLTEWVAQQLKAADPQE